MALQRGSNQAQGSGKAPLEKGSGIYAESLRRSKNGADKERGALQAKRMCHSQGPEKSLGPSRKKPVYLQNKNKAGKRVHDKVRSSRDQILQGPVNYFKDFGPDSKSKENQLKTFK